MTRVITFGTFDLFHYGHVKMLERCKAFGDYRVVGVSTDKLNEQKKGRKPVFPYQERAAIVSAMRFVDAVFPEESLELKEHYIKDWLCDVFVIGDDWKGKFDHLTRVCRVEYLPRTPGVSTTELMERICLKSC